MLNSLFKFVQVKYLEESNELACIEFELIAQTIISSAQQLCLAWSAIASQTDQHWWPHRKSSLQQCQRVSKTRRYRPAFRNIPESQHNKCLESLEMPLNLSRLLEHLGTNMVEWVYRTKRTGLPKYIQILKTCCSLKETKRDHFENLGRLTQVWKTVIKCD